jgi:hypothetical protein
MKQTVIIPFADFTPLAVGTGSFDFKHLKDWTFVDPKPVGQPFVFSNMILLGGAPGCNGISTGNGTVPSTTSGSGTGSTTNGGTTNTGSTNLKSFAHPLTAQLLNLWLMLLTLFA